MLFPTLDALRLIAYHAAICIFVSLCSGHLHSLDQVHIFEDQSNHVRSGIFFLLVYIKFDKKFQTHKYLYCVLFLLSLFC